MNNFERSRSNYINYKFGNLSIINALDMVDVELLSMLDRLAFPMNDMDAYIYKDLILYVIDKLKMVDEYGDSSCLELIVELNDKGSQIYRDFANCLGMGYDKLHLRLNGIISKIDVSKMDGSLLLSICKEYSYDLNYGELAFVLASKILGFKKEKKNSLVRIRSL